MKTVADYTLELAARVLDITLLGQLPYDESDLAALRAGLRPLFAGGTTAGLRRIDGRHDLAFAVYLVLEGTYHYDAGDYWAGPRRGLALDGLFQGRVGDRFRRTLREWGLPTFEPLGGHVHVTPILAHVGIPNYCLDDFFDLLDKALRRDAAPDAATLIDEWGETEFPPTIDRPVRRFLRFGGPVAEDFVGRCLELWQAGDSAELDLPRRVVDRYETWRAARGPRAAPAGLRLTRPVLRLDPYGEGPTLVLSPVVFAADQAPARLVWRIEAGERRRDETAVRRRTAEGYAYAPRAAVNVLTVAPRYVVTLLADDRPLQTWTLAGPHDPPWLAFDPDTGDALPLGREGAADELLISPGERWLAFPRDWTPDEGSAARRLAVLPDQPGDWAAFTFQTWRLGPDERLAFAAPDGRWVTLRTQHDPAPTRPRLVGRRVAGDGLGAPALFGEPPALLFPHVGRAERPSAWRCVLEPLGPARPSARRRVSLDALAHRLQVTDEGLRLPLAAPELLGAEPFGAFRLRARGPYGRSAEFEFRVVPGLQLDDYPRLYRGEADGPATLTVTCPPGVAVAAASEEAAVTVVGPRLVAGRAAWTITAAPWQTVAPLSLRHPSGAVVEADIPIYRLRWGVREPDRPDGFTWSGALLTLYPDGLLNRHAAELRVDRPFWDERPPATGWQLIGSGGRVLRGPLMSDRPGRYVATPLVEWLDAYYEARGAACLQLLLDDGEGHPVAIDVAAIQPTLDLGHVEASWTVDAAGGTLMLFWERNTPLLNRQLRLWPLDRPWRHQPVVLPVPDAAEVGHEWVLPSGALPPDEYLAEMVVANPWGGAARRPGPDTPGVFTLMPDAFDRVLAERVAAAADGAWDSDALLGLLLCVVRRPDLRDALADVGNALWRCRAELSADLLLVWANVTRESGNTPAYRLAQRALFAPERVAALSADGNFAQSALPYIDHLPPRLSQIKVYADLLPLAGGEKRRLCIEELCRDGHEAGYAALLADVARARISLSDAASMAQQKIERAVDFLLNTDAHAAEPLLRALLPRLPANSLLARGVDLNTNLGYAQVTSVRDRHSGKLLNACRNADGPFEVWAELSPGADPVTIILDLAARQIRFPNPAFPCRHNGDACNRVFGSAERLEEHYKKVHRLFVPYVVKRVSVPSQPLRLLKVMPPDGVELS